MVCDIHFWSNNNRRISSVVEQPIAARQVDDSISSFFFSRFFKRGTLAGLLSQTPYPLRRWRLIGCFPIHFLTHLVVEGEALALAEAALLERHGRRLVPQQHHLAIRIIEKHHPTHAHEPSLQQVPRHLRYNSRAVRRGSTGSLQFNRDFTRGFNRVLKIQQGFHKGFQQGP
jgi:hypothetical protein